jgi:hypothetical protein
MDRFRSLLRKLIVEITAIAIAVIFVPAAQAAQVSQASDTVSRHTVSTLSNHQIVFTTPSGVDAPADTVTISFPSFSFGSLDFGDVDVSYGPTTGFETSLTLAATPAAGVWGVSVSGTVLVISAPSDAAAGTVPAGSKIGIRIGTNATGGVNRLTNPAAATVAQIAIGGTFGDSGTIGVPIVGNDSVSVSATVGVATSSGNGGNNGNGGGGNSGGVTPPAISGVQAINLTSTSASIVWTTDKSSDSTVEYGLSVAYASGTMTDASSVFSHSIPLSGLTPATTYHFRVRSFDPVTLLASVSLDYTFTTPADDAPPIISNVQAVNVTDAAATITWSTNEPATSVVLYGLAPSYGLQSSAPGLVAIHSVPLSGLTKSTTYHFRVVSADGQGLSASSTDFTFTTAPDVTAPANVALTAIAGNATVSLSWVSPNDPDYAGVRIRRKLGGFPTGPSDGVLVYDGLGNATNDVGLINGQTYFYAAFAYDADGNFASGSLANAVPSAPVVPVLPQDPPPNPPPVDQQIPPSGGNQSPPVVVPAPGAVIPPGTVPGSGAATSVVAVLPLTVYYRGAGGVELVPDEQGRIGVLAGSPVTILVPVAGLNATLENVVAQIGAVRYLLALDASATFFSATVQVPTPGVTPVRIDGFISGSDAVRSVSGALLVQGRGRIVQATPVGAEDEGVSEASIQLYREEAGVWAPYGAEASSGGDGDFGFVVPNGRYYVEVRKPGFEPFRSTVREVATNVFAGRFSVIRLPMPLPTSTQVLERPGEALQAVQSQVSYRIVQIQEVLERPEIRQTSEIVRDVAVVASVAGLAGSSFGILALLQWAFTQPILLLGRRKATSWGTVYNVLSHRPVDLAIVRLVRADNGTVIQTRVTDRDGRYAFRPPKGLYRVEVVKPGFVFPSQLLKGASEDGDFSDLYHGDPIEVSVDGGLVALNIPGDPIVVDGGVRRTVAKHYFRKIQASVAVLGVGFSLVVAIVYPTPFNAALFVLQAVTLVMFRRLAAPRPPKPWGRVRTSARRPLGGAVVRIFEKRFNKLLEMQVTGRGGDFGFFVGKNTYYLTAQKTGFAPETSKEISVTDDRAPIEGQDVVLKKK